MSDLIERKDAIEVLAWHMYDVALLKADGRLDTMDSYRKSAEITMRHIPSADRPRGEWIKHKERTEINGKFIDFFPAEYECSNCGLREAHYFINPKPHNFCPNCGAKMKGTDDETD